MSRWQTYQRMLIQMDKDRAMRQRRSRDCWPQFYIRKKHCQMCEGMDHHWMPDCDEDNGMPVMTCKHCEARRPYTDEDGDF